MTFWKMTLNTLRSLEIPQAELEKRFEDSRWPLIPPSVRPPTNYVVEQVSSHSCFDEYFEQLPDHPFLMNRSRHSFKTFEIGKNKSFDISTDWKRSSKASKQSSRASQRH